MMRRRSDRQSGRRALRRSVRRRGFVIITVFIVVGALLLLTMGLLSRAQLELTATSQATATAQRHALARSAVRVLLHEFDRQREDILASNPAVLDEQYTLYDLRNRLGVMRLQAIGVEQSRAQPESSLLDVNHVTTEMLNAFEFIPVDVAQRIPAFREARGRPYTSLADLLEVDGVDAELLFGPPRGEGDGVSSVDPSFDTAPRALADVLTVFGVEPALQRNGRLRINLNTPWSDELGGRLNERFGEGTDAIVKDIMGNGTTFESDAKLYEVMLFFKMEPSEWPEVVDALTTSLDPFLYGRLNINTASADVLAALPELDMETAASIVDARQSLTDEERQTEVWPVLRDLVPAATYATLGPKLTTRSWTYRVRFEVGEVNAEDSEGDLDRPLGFEAVIDLASPRARLAALREITLSPIAYELRGAEIVGEISDFSTENRESDDIQSVEGFSDVEAPAAPEVDRDQQPEPPSPVSEEIEAPASSAGTTSGARMGRWRTLGSASNAG
ncbi:MAG: helix-hairpin-helix domain-containing protein [Phycisphaerales bacterium]|nr:helix-hairpin-helix domain-containing protein [Phycisphaerales bacterium]